MNGNFNLINNIFKIYLKLLHIYYYTHSMSSEETQTERSSGRVKWFNNRAGYGFITVSDGERQGEDVFVHHSALNVETEQYKYLIEGEYVGFGWTSTENTDEHKWQASSVSGVNGGKLMCETRNNTRSVRKDSDERHPRQSRPSRSLNGPRLYGSGPRSSVRDENGVEWMLVRKNCSSDKQPRQYRN